MVSAPLMSAAHPRSRGENPVDALCGVLRAGSSPLTRGKLDSAPSDVVLARLIPAHAGKTKSVIMTGIARAAHPRSRGENEIARAEDVNGNGSSPLTRGKPGTDFGSPSLDRLIPAHAGKTDRPGPRGAGRSAHPRSRGENGPTWSHVRTLAGSSPLTRGKPCVRSRGWRRGRLIPAHAGKTRAAVPTRRLARAHPRSRGENSRHRRLAAP